MSDITIRTEQGDDDEKTPEHAIVKLLNRLITHHEVMTARILEMADVSSQRASAAEKTVARHAEAHLKTIEQLEELLSLRHERELKSAQAKRDAELKGAIVSDLRALAPLVVKKFAGIPLADGSGFKDLVASISEEQFGAMISGQPVTFTDAQRELLVAALGKEADKEPQAAE